MSRYDVEKFHPPPDPELICCICQCVLDNAKESPCRHVFCKVCIEQWLEDHNSCPTCRTWLSKHDLQNVLPLVQNMINKLAMYCDFRNNGCDEKIILEMYDAHIQKCDFKLLQCPYPGCNSTVLHKDLSKHMNELCTFREVTCNRGCYLKIPINEVPVHDCLSSLKKKSEKQQKLIEEYLKKIKEFITLNDTLKRKVENLLRNFDDTSPHSVEGVSNLFSSSYEDEEDNTSINVLRRTADNSVTKLLVMCNYLEFYTDAIDQITDEINQLQGETSPVINSGSTSTTIAAATAEPTQNSEDTTESRQNVAATSVEPDLRGNNSSESRRFSSTRFSQSSETYLSNGNPDQDPSANAESVLSNSVQIYSGETGSATTGPEDYTATDRELEVSYVADSEEGNNSSAGFNYNNASDDDDLFDWYVDEEEVTSDVSSSMHSSLVTNVPLESTANDATSQPENFFDPEYWIDTYYPQSSDRGNEVRTPENGVEFDNVSVNATDGDSYTHHSEENYLSSNYLSSPSVTSVQFSPLVSSSPQHESDSDMYVLFSDYSDDDEVNHDIELVSENEVRFAVPLESHCDNPHSDDSRTMSDDEDEGDDDDDDEDDDDDDDDRNNSVYQLTFLENQNSIREENDEETSSPANVCLFDQPEDSSTVRVSTTNNSNLDINEVSITHVYSSDNKLSAPNERPVNRVSSQVSLYQQRHRYYDFNSEPLAVPSQHHVLRLLQSNKDSMRFSQHVVSGNTESTRQTPGVSIKIEPTLDFIRVSSSDSGNIQKSTLTTRTVCVPLHDMNTCNSDDVKVISERVVQADTTLQYPSSQNTSRYNQRRKRQNSSPSANSFPSKVRRGRDHSNFYPQSTFTTTIRNRVKSLKNEQNTSNQHLKHHFPNRQHASQTTTSTAASSANISAPSNTAVMSSCRPSSRYTTLHSSWRGTEPCNNNRTRCNTKKTAAACERQMTTQTNVQINQLEDRSLPNVNSTDGTVLFGLPLPDQLHSHRSEHTLDQTDSDNASYEPSESCSDSEVPESDSSYEVLIPKTISQLLDEYNSDETDESWSVGMD
ncbi:TNF receptor-associated factor family protein DDB_G0272098 [Octopus sinensis]|uniref:TNF receptor-associated factor family protein DDB_G0272098 n=1 Tax=Octopus sinensis TaxID=2607531 RepID=A0A6P7SDD5_9MOLL|nr:TNF receptor-associated factor family protein DDB_G0272098 [Octopus sinensis]